MRAMLLLLLGGALLLGCKHANPSDSSGRDQAAAAKTKPEKSSKRTAREVKGQADRATPLNEPVGKVASVNSGLRFVVVDFAFNPMPQAEQRMGVYRDGQKVGEVKISGQSRNSIIAADITAGEAQVGDEIRPQ
ncbi:MAG: hypothetical protein U1G07_23765 [Verrucomicrobiota bacterium]